MIGYGLIGCGYSGGIHAENIDVLADARLVAVYDTDNKNAHDLAKRWGARVMDSVESLCSCPEISAIVVSTPNCSHVKPTLCALQHKKHVFCEKPVSLSLQDTRVMVEASVHADRILFAAHTTNFIRGVETAKVLISENRIGDLVLVEGVHTDWAGPQAVIGWKQRKAESGGHLYHHMHEVDLMCQLAGRPQAVYGAGGNFAHQGPGFGDEEDALMLLMEFDSGVLASLTIGSAFHIGDHYVKLQGKTGGILLDFKNSFVRLENGTGIQTFHMQEDEKEDEERRFGYQRMRTDAGKGFGYPGMGASGWMKTIFYKELQCFDGFIKSGKIAPEFKSLVDGSAAMSCAAVLDAAQRSVVSGQREMLGSVAECQSR